VANRLARPLLVLLALSLLGAKPNVILITIDTLRADHLGAYGYFRPTSPSIDRLAEQGVLFERAVATMSTTLPSHTSIMTSSYPARHGVLSNLRFFHQPVVTSDELRTAAQLFKAAGYSTAAFTSSSPLSEVTGIQTGFDHFVGPPPYETNDRRIDIPAEATTVEVLRWLLQARSPFFLWVHYFDPHSPFKPPPPFDRRFQAGPDLRQLLKSRAVPEGRYTDATRDVNGYDGEILYMDGQVGRLLDRLREYLLYDDALIVFTADHGEGLWQHDWQLHGPIWNEQTYAPLIFKLPKRAGRPPERRLQLASLIDVLPTMIAAGELPLPREGLDGIDLFSEQREFALSERTSREDPRWSGQLFALTSLDWKYYLYTESPHELYDLTKDPHETRNVIGEHPEIAERMRAEALRLIDANRARSPLRTKESIPDSIREQLRKLGYVE
jgi:arylsulfatase A-like enzyme